MSSSTLPAFDYKSVLYPGSEFEKLYQIYPMQSEAPSSFPYDFKGIRIIGGRHKDTSQITPQSIRFSGDSSYNWNPDAIKDHLNLCEFRPISSPSMTKAIRAKIRLRNNPDDGIYRTRSFPITKIVNKGEWIPGEPLIIEGTISDKSVDAHGEIVDPVAIMNSKTFYMKFPTVRLMHQADPIGKTLKLWQEGNAVKARIYISASAAKTIQLIIEGIISAFSIGFLWVEGKFVEVQPNVKVYMYTVIRLIEISPVDSPANRNATIDTLEPVKSLEPDPLETMSPSEILERTRTTHITDDTITLPIAAKSLTTPSGGIVMEKKEDEEEEVVEEEPEEEASETDTSEETTSEDETSTDDETEETTEETTEEEPEKSLETENAELKAMLSDLQEAVELLKLSDEERKEKEKADKIAADAVAPHLVKNAELTDKIKDLEAKLEAKEADDQRLRELGATRDSFSIDGTKMIDENGVPVDTSEADRKCVKFLRGYM